MGLGAGWFELEYGMYGIPFPAPAQRIHELDEACQVLKLLWTQELSDFQGRYYQLQAARHEPKPVQQPHPPFTIGGRGEQLTLRVVAKHAAIYNLAGGTPEDAAHKNAVLDGHCAAIGRDPATIRRSYQFYLQTPDEVREVRAKIEPYLAVGIDHIVVGVPTAYEPGLVAAVAAEVAPLLAGSAG
jgi:alkanesulfonate monooxygenase SsuD/methylene tetrahydromethanopterin reductase-like flavin-dependent oxidoreductase (luciferase family)